MTLLNMVNRHGLKNLHLENQLMKFRHWRYHLHWDHWVWKVQVCINISECTFQKNIWTILTSIPNEIKNKSYINWNSYYRDFRIRKKSAKYNPEDGHTFLVRKALLLLNSLVTSRDENSYSFKTLFKQQVIELSFEVYNYIKGAF